MIVDATVGLGDSQESGTVGRLAFSEAPMNAAKKMAATPAANRGKNEDRFISPPKCRIHGM
jgi:hypothetical protein